MLNKIFTEMLDNLIYSTVLWYAFYNNLLENYTEILANVTSLKSFLFETINGKKPLTYEAIYDLEYIILIVTFIQKSTECMIKYERQLSHYISVLTNNIKQVPKHISGVVFIWKPKKPNNFLEIINVCSEIINFILKVSSFGDKCKT
jgi:hypothetical protein